MAGMKLAGFLLTIVSASLLFLAIFFWSELERGSVLQFGELQLDAIAACVLVSLILLLMLGVNLLIFWPDAILQSQNVAEKERAILCDESRAIIRMLGGQAALDAHLTMMAHEIESAEHQAFNDTDHLKGGDEWVQTYGRLRDVCEKKRRYFERIRAGAQHLGFSVRDGHLDYLVSADLKST